MKTIKLEIELTYDDVSWHAGDEIPEDKNFFYNEVLLGEGEDEPDLILHSNLCGEEVGTVVVTKIIGEK